MKARDVQSAIWSLRSLSSPQVRFLFRRLEAQGIGTTRGTAEALEWCFILPQIGPGCRKEFLG
ncbi:MAG: hypothetical protein SFW36_13960 [Leptolyngbyaceae cyanobacterium bins.59]|nr:hypothetical protein [Leptolyngbyaceae cyanobacterium bins.59]